MKRIHLERHYYWYDYATRILYYDRQKSKEVQQGLFNYTQYHLFLNQITIK